MISLGFFFLIFGAEVRKSGKIWGDGEDKGFAGDGVLAEYNILPPAGPKSSGWYFCISGIRKLSDEKDEVVFVILKV